jgi:hypothetical protein
MEMFKGNSEKVCDITHAGAVPARRLEAMDQSLESPKKWIPLTNGVIKAGWLGNLQNPQTKWSF